MSSMRKQYGNKKSKEVFYASKNKGSIEGVDEALGTQYGSKGSKLRPTAQRHTTNPGESKASARKDMSQFAKEHKRTAKDVVKQTGKIPGSKPGQQNEMVAAYKDLALRIDELAPLLAVAGKAAALGGKAILKGGAMAAKSLAKGGAKAGKAAASGTKKAAVGAGKEMARGAGEAIANKHLKKHMGTEDQVEEHIEYKNSYINKLIEVSKK